MDSVPAYAAVSATVDQVRVEVGARPTGFVNAVLRRVAADTAVPPEDMNSLLALTTWGFPSRVACSAMAFTLRRD